MHKSIEATLRNHEASIHNMKNHARQMAKMLSERLQVPLRGSTELNPREHVKFVTLRKGKELKTS